MSGTSIRARQPVSARAPKSILRLRGDEDLVARARQGDERAFELLYERHLAGVLAFCRHMLGDPEEAEDAVQQVFVAAHAELVDSERPLHLRAWLYTVARNRCLSVLRARRERPAEDLELSTAGLQEEVQQRADLRELLGDLYDLPDDQRAALVLSELEDLSHQEIADVLDCEVRNVKGLVFRARAGLTERHEAREAPCSDIRTELAAARRGGLRRGRLRYHLKACSGCAAYLTDLRRQRSLLALALPVAPSVGLKPAVLGSIGLGGGAAAAGGLVALGTAGTAATVAVTAVIAGAAGLAGHGPLSADGPSRDTQPRPAASPAPAEVPDASTPAGERATRRRGVRSPGPTVSGGGQPSRGGGRSSGRRPGRAGGLGRRDRGAIKKFEGSKPRKAGSLDKPRTGGQIKPRATRPRSTPAPRPKAVQPSRPEPPKRPAREKKALTAPEPVTDEIEKLKQE